MPTYTYQCPDCQEVYDVILKVSELDKKTVQCLDCDKTCDKAILDAPPVKMPPGFAGPLNFEKYYGHNPVTGKVVKAFTAEEVKSPEEHQKQGYEVRDIE